MKGRVSRYTAPESLCERIRLRENNSHYTAFTKQWAAGHQRMAQKGLRVWVSVPWRKYHLVCCWKPKQSHRQKGTCHTSLGPAHMPGQLSTTALRPGLKGTGSPAPSPGRLRHTDRGDRAGQTDSLIFPGR